MWYVPSAVLIGLLAAMPQVAQPQSPKDRFATLLSEYTKAEGAWTERYSPGGKRTPDDETLVRYRDWPTWTFLPRFMEFAEQNPKDPAAVDALLWIVDQGQAIGLTDKEYYPFLVCVLEQLEHAQIIDNKPFPRPRWVMRHPSPATERFLRNVLAKNKSRDVRGRACYYLGDLLINRAEIANKPWFDKENKTPFETFLALRFHPEVLQYIRQTDQHASAAEGELILERAITEFGDVHWDGQVDAKGRPAPGRTIGGMARRELDEIRRTPAGRDTTP